MSSKRKQAEDGEEKPMDVIDLTGSSDEEGGEIMAKMRRCEPQNDERPSDVSSSSNRSERIRSVVRRAVSSAQARNSFNLPITRETPYRMADPNANMHGLSILYFPAMTSPVELDMFRIVGGRLPGGALINGNANELLDHAIRQFSPADNGMLLPKHMAKYGYSMEISSRTFPKDSLVLEPGFCWDRSIDIYATEECVVERRATVMFRRCRGYMLDGVFYPAIKWIPAFIFTETISEESDVLLECVATVERQGDLLTIRLDCIQEPTFWITIQRDLSEPRLVY